jgi:hypothetical protein
MKRHPPSNQGLKVAQQKFQAVFAISNPLLPPIFLPKSPPLF